jgi:hypothetical protein
VTSGAIRADLKLILAFDVDHGSVDDVASYRPKDENRFAVQLSLLVGTPENDFGDTFEIIVCSPRWLLENLDAHWPAYRLGSGAVLPGRDLWLMKHWDYDRVKQSVNQILGSVTAETWDDLANWLGRHLSWEYHYKYDAEHSVVVDLSRWDVSEP